MTEDELKNMDTRDKFDKAFNPDPLNEEKTSFQISLTGPSPGTPAGDINIIKVWDAPVPTEGGSKSIPVKLMNPTVAISNPVTSLSVSNLSTIHKDRDIVNVGSQAVPTVGSRKVIPVAAYNSSGAIVSIFSEVATDCEDITGNDTTSYTGVIAFKPAADGNIKILTEKNNERTIAVKAGVKEHVAIKKFLATGSDSISLRLYYL